MGAVSSEVQNICNQIRYAMVHHDQMQRDVKSSGCCLRGPSKGSNVCGFLLYNHLTYESIKFSILYADALLSDTVLPGIFQSLLTDCASYVPSELLHPLPLPLLSLCVDA